MGRMTFSKNVDIGSNPIFPAIIFFKREGSF
jgi:hypothetical protein